MQLKFETCVVFRLSSPPPRPRFPSQNQEEARCCPPTPLAGLCLFCASLPQKDVEKNKKPLSRRVWKSEISAMARKLNWQSRVDFAFRIDDLPALSRKSSKAEGAMGLLNALVFKPLFVLVGFLYPTYQSYKVRPTSQSSPFTAPFPLTETDPTPLPPGTSSSSSRRPWSPTAPTRPRNGSHTG